MTRARDLADSADKDIVGTLTVDGLSVDTSADGNISTFKGDLNYFYIKGSGADTILSTVGSGGNASNLFFQTDPFASEVNRMQINKDGDISFYEDTGTTAKFFWDASAESLGIGTSSPSTLMHISGISASTDGIHYIAENTRVSGGPAGIVMKSTHGDWKMINSQTVADALEFIDGTAGATRMLIDSSGNVGIGTTSTSLGRLTVVQDYATNGDTLVLKTPAASGGGSQSGIKFVRNTDATLAQVYADTNSGAFITNVGGSEAMRIDSNGTVGIGVVPASTWDTFSAVQIQGASVGGYGNNNTILGSNIYHDNPTGYKYIGAAAASVYQQRFGEHRWYGAPSGTADAAVTMTQHMTIDSNGRVAIGKTSATAMLDIDSTALTAVQVSTSQGYSLFNGSSAGAGARISITAADASTGISILGYNDAQTGYTPLNYSAADHRFKIGSSEKVRINSGGALNVNTTTGLPTSGNAGVSLQPAGNVHCGVATTSAADVMRFDNPNGRIGSITASGTSTSYNTSSDYRLKENVTDVTDGITRVKQLAPKRFNFIADPDTTVDGFLAHEAQAVVPEAVTGTQDALDAEGNPDYQGIDQSKLVPLLTAALQEAIAKIETLETKVAALEAN